MQLRSCQFLHSTPELEHLQGARASVLAHTKPSQHGRTQRRFLFPRDYCISVSKPRFWEVLSPDCQTVFVCCMQYYAVSNGVQPIKRITCARARECVRVCV